MTKIQKAITVVAAFVLMIGLSACGSMYEVPDKGSDDISEFTVTLADQTEVPCFKIDGYKGIVCNFDKAVRSNAPTP